MHKLMTYKKNGKGIKAQVESFKRENREWYEWFDGRNWTLVSGVETGVQVAAYSNFMKNQW